jgi:hypothetical protein
MNGDVARERSRRIAAPRTERACARPRRRCVPRSRRLPGRCFAAGRAPRRACTPLARTPCPWACAIHANAADPLSACDLVQSTVPGRDPRNPRLRREAARRVFGESPARDRTAHPSASCQVFGARVVPCRGCSARTPGRTPKFRAPSGSRTTHRIPSRWSGDVRLQPPDPQVLPGTSAARRSSGIAPFGTS